MGAVLAHRDRRTVVWGEHEAIAEGILAGDPESAAAAAIRHSENAGNTLYTRLSQENLTT
jgi:DNA-binding FadR family transcriptional regulator